MSYMRFPLYAWRSLDCEEDCPDDCHNPEHETMHLWVQQTEDDRVSVLEDPDSYDVEGGIGVRGDLFDQLVLCRFAEIIYEGRFDEVAKPLLDRSSPAYGNFGSFQILKALGADPEGEFRKLIEFHKLAEKTKSEADAERP